MQKWMHWVIYMLLLLSCSVVSDSLGPHGLQHTGFPVLHHLLELSPIHVHWVGDAIQISHPLLSPSPPAFNFSQHQGFSNESALQFRWPKYWSLISRVDFFRIDWFDLLAVQGILKSLLQHHSSKTSIYMLGNLYFTIFQNVSYGTLILQNTLRKKYT